MGWSLSRSRWRKRSPRSKPYFFVVLSFFFLFFIVFLFFFPNTDDFLRLFLPRKTLDRLQSAAIQCGPQTDADDRFLWYAPHSGFTNQLWELKNAIIFAAILNRTLIVPPVLDHHAIALGSCPKFRVTSPSDLRIAVWDHITDLIRDRRYISIGDIVDLSSVGHKWIRMIDFRIFVSMWCDFNLNETCFGNPCCTISDVELSSTNLNKCKSLLSGLFDNVNPCIHAVEEDCRTTVWTYQQGNDGTLDSFQPDKQLLKRKKISYVRKRQDLYKAFGPGSDAEMAKILAFGSLFTAPYKGSELYISIHEAPGDSRIQSLIRDIEFLPFAPEIIAAGKQIAKNKIKKPFLCAQLRLLDGQFKNHWKATFSELKQKLQLLHSEHDGKKENNLIHIFIMTDLPASNWTGTYLESLANDIKSYKLHILHENDELVIQAAKRIIAPKNITSMHTDRVCGYVSSQDILLYIEETICSCASMGFVGTAGSTIAESILSMRKNNICLL